MDEEFVFYRPVYREFLYIDEWEEARQVAISGELLVLPPGGVGVKHLSDELSCGAAAIRAVGCVQSLGWSVLSELAGAESVGGLVVLRLVSGELVRSDRSGGGAAVLALSTLASAVAGGAVRRRVPSPAPPAAHRLSMPSALGRRWRPAVRRLSAAWERTERSGRAAEPAGWEWRRAEPSSAGLRPLKEQSPPPRRPLSIETKAASRCDVPRRSETNRDAPRGA
ncbi:hypothetical protein FJT64_016304 [Amphibalanus amphitrite]|uniref:Uncharacterized protein n=1 Tax=Amphibalanus amphitrite TaxID=1232801 RepID=A0A6A4X1E6_AMPAM|nr:hypothetical protein FJT64_016304 [Amphibalanus amphitrite]